MDVSIQDLLRGKRPVPIAASQTYHQRSIVARSLRCDAGHRFGCWSCPGPMVQLNDRGLATVWRMVDGDNP